MHLPGVQTLDEVKASGRYRFLTPDQLIAEVRDADNYGPIVLHPLVGGMPVDEAWKSVQLLTDNVAARAHLTGVPSTRLAEASQPEVTSAPARRPGFPVRTLDRFERFGDIAIQRTTVAAIGAPTAGKRNRAAAKASWTSRPGRMSVSGSAPMRSATSLVARSLSAGCAP